MYTTSHARPPTLLEKNTLSHPHLRQYNRYGSNVCASSGLKLNEIVSVTAPQRHPTLPWQDFHFNGNWDRSSPKSQLGWSVLPNLPLHCGKFASAIACYLSITSTQVPRFRGGVKALLT